MLCVTVTPPPATSHSDAARAAATAMMACLGRRMADPLRLRKNTPARGAFEGQNRAPRNGAGAALDDGKLVAVFTPLSSPHLGPTHRPITSACGLARQVPLGKRIAYLEPKAL